MTPHTKDGTQSCEYCGKSFIKHSSNNKYCSARCRQRARDKRLNEQLAINGPICKTHGCTNKISVYGNKYCTECQATKKNRRHQHGNQPTVVARPWRDVAYSPLDVMTAPPEKLSRIISRLASGWAVFVMPASGIGYEMETSLRTIKAKARLL